MSDDPDPPSDRSLTRDYFDAVYGANPDPWGFATSPYEAAKYEATLAALPQLRYRNAFEIGCSIGVLTEWLADRCDRLLAVDVVPDVLWRAAERCRAKENVRFAEMSVPQEYPNERFDLILLSEVGYYWSTSDLGRARALIVDSLESGGHLVLVHWTPAVHDYPISGDTVHEEFLSRPELLHIAGQREATYRLDVLARRQV